MDFDPWRGRPARARRRLPILLAGGLLALALAGCGSGVQTVSVKSPPPGAQAELSRGVGPQADTGGESGGTSAPTNEAEGEGEGGAGSQTEGPGGAEAPNGEGGEGGGEHTAPEPEFAEKETEPTQPGSPLSLSEAEGLVGSKGYQTTDSSGYLAEAALSVLMGKNGAGAEQAFFFAGGVYLGTDTSTPSADVVLAGHSGDEVTLEYGLYAKHGEEATGSAQVSYRLEGQTLVPLDPIPSVSERR